jgi:AraC-like DNA-binding protein
MMQRTVNIHQPVTSPENIFIRQIWSSRDSSLAERTEKILPQGTAELIFNLSGGGIYRSKEGEKAIRVPAYFINGLNSSSIDLEIKQTQYFIGVQFNIFALRYLFDVPVSEFNDRILEGSLICKSLDGLSQRLRESTSFTEQVAAIMSWFRSKLETLKTQGVNRRIISMHSDPNLINLSVGGMSEKYNVSPRQLNRLCIEYLGMCPEDVILYRKYLLALHQLHHRQYSLTEITYISGFYDQAHFARTFKAFTGMSPRQYRKSAGTLPGHLFNLGHDPMLSFQA